MNDQLQENPKGLDYAKQLMSQKGLDQGDVEECALLEKVIVELDHRIQRIARQLSDYRENVVTEESKLETLLQLTDCFKAYYEEVK